MTTEENKATDTLMI